MTRDMTDLGVPTKVHTRDPETLKPVIEARLAARFPDRRGLHVSGIAVPSGAGVANETLLLDLAWEGGAGGAAMRIDTDDPLFTWPTFPDHSRLYQVMRETGCAPAPEIFAIEPDPAVIGRPFFLMERIAGQVPSDQPMFHAAGWMHDLTDADRAAMWRRTVEAMVRLHATPLQALGFLRRPALGASGVEQELRGALRYMDWALAGDRHPIVEAGAEWLVRNLPADAGTGFAWGDARPQNVMFRDGEVVALFDWDMASLAGAEADLAWWTLMDLSNTVTRGLPRIGGWGSPAQTMALWEQLSGRTLLHMDWHFRFAAFRGGVIVMRLAKMLAAKGQLPPQSADWKDNNIGIQYLASMLDLAPMTPDSRPWPGPDA